MPTDLDSISTSFDTDCRSDLVPVLGDTASATAVEQAEFIERRQCINCDSEQVSKLASGTFRDPPISDFIRADPHGESPLPHLRDAEWALIQCSECRQVYHRNVLTREWSERQHTVWMDAESIHEFCDRLGSNTPSARLDRARSHVSHALRIEMGTRQLRREDEPARVLDFGCGFGQFVQMCREFGMDAHGIDRAAPRIPQASDMLHASLEDIADRPPFHAITMFDVLEHLDDPSDVLRRLNRMLLPGGILVLETPDCTGVTNILTLEDYRKVDPLNHVNAFTRETLCSMASRHGFEVISRGSVHVTCERIRVLRSELKHLLRQDGRSTQLYLRSRSPTEIDRRPEQ